MKNTVIEFFQNLPDEKSEQFNKAFELYRKHPQKNHAVERSLNAQGFSTRALDNLLYDLQKIYEISDVEKVAVVESSKPKVELTELPDYILAFSEEELRAWAQTECVEKGVGLEEVIEIALASEQNEIAAILQEELAKINEASVQASGNVNTDNIPVVGAEIVTGDAVVSLREEFPFLNDKDCPNELKILVADKMTAYKTYEENHAKLGQIIAGELKVSDEEKAEISKLVVDAFDENQKIYDELNHYKEKGELLGNHPIFKTLQFQREVDEMTPEELNKYIGSSAKYFTDNKKSLAKAESDKDEEKIVIIKERVADREVKLAMVNKKLGIPAK